MVAVLSTSLISVTGIQAVSGVVNRDQVVCGSTSAPEMTDSTMEKIGMRHIYLPGLGKVAHLKRMEIVRIRNVETFGNIQKLTLKVTISPYRFGLGQVFYKPER